MRATVRHLLPGLALIAVASAALLGADYWMMSRRAAEKAREAAQAPASGAAAQKIAPDAVTIMGEEKLKVYLEVDYVRFRAPANQEAPESPSPASSTAATAKS